MIKSKKQSLIVIGAFILVLLLGTTTYAFFNYTRTGSNNTIRVGKMEFNTNEKTTILLTNVFPMSREEAINNTTSGDNVTIQIKGDTTYSNGIEYLVTAESINSTVNNKKIPLSLIVDNAEDLGTLDNDYYEHRGGNTSIYKPLVNSIIMPGQYILVGYIAPGSTGIDGEIRIKSYVDETKIIISDTDTNPYEIENLTNGVVISSENDKVYVTTDEWKNFNSNNPLSFKIRIEANEGTWVREETNPNAMNALNFNKNTGAKEIHFIKETPNRMNERYNAATEKSDLTYNNEGKVLAWQEGDIIYVASSGETYLTTGYALFSGFNNIEKIVFENVNTSRVDNMTAMFYNCSKLESVDLRKLDTSNVISMSAMFSGCSNLVSVNLSGLGSDSFSGNGGMFSGCSNLKTINMSNFNFGTSSMSGLFASLSKLETADLSNANTSKVTNMSGLFNNDSNLISVDLTNTGSDVLNSVGNMFYGCSKLKEINMSGFNFGTSSVAYRSGAQNSPFPSAYNVEKIDLSNANLGKAADLYRMFYNLPSLKTLDLSNVDMSSAITMENMFENCRNLTNLNLSNVNTSSVMYMYNTFNGCSSLVDIDLSNLGSSNLLYISNIFNNCTSLKNVNMSGFNFGTVDFSNSGSGNIIFQGNTVLETVNFSNANMSNVKSLAGLFAGCTNLLSVDFSNVHTDKVTSMVNMFYGCSKLTSLNLDGMGSKDLLYVNNMFGNTPLLENISMRNFIFGTSMEYLFAYAYGLKTFDLTNADMSDVENMYGMFMSCSNITDIDISYFNAPKVTSMGAMFSSSINLKNLNLSGQGGDNLSNITDIFHNSVSLENINMENFNYGNVVSIGQQNSFRYLSKLKTVNLKNAKMSGITNAYEAFYQCSNLESVDFTGTDLSNITNTIEMFDGCRNLTSIDLSNLGTGNLQSINLMFYNCESLNKIYVSSDWNETTLNTGATNVFSGCNSLVGGNGTTYDSSKVGYSMAVIDNNDHEGYLTLKTN